MRAIPMLRGPALACTCALALMSASSLAAQQAGGKQPPDARDAKRSPGTAGAKEAGKKKQPRQRGAAVDHAVLMRANQKAMREARTLRRQAAEQDAQLSKKMVTRHAKSIDEALDTARKQVALLEAGTPATDEELQNHVEQMRDNYESAAEHQLALLEETEQPQIDPDAIEQEAEALVSDLQEAEQAHRKMPGAPAVHGPTGTGAAQDQPAGPEVPAGRPSDGRKRDREAPNQQRTPDSP